MQLWFPNIKPPGCLGGLKMITSNIQGIVTIKLANMIDHIDPISLSLIPKGSLSLGCPIPQECHAVSVSLPTWSAVVGYEEGDATICSQLAIGYPRFKIHVYHEIMVQKLMDDYEEDNGSMTCMILPKNSAQRCLNFIKNDPRAKHIDIRNIEGTDLFAVYFDVVLQSRAKSFWQHSGEIISSRQAVLGLAALGIEAPPVFSGTVNIVQDSIQGKTKEEIVSIIKSRILAIAVPSAIDHLSDSEKDLTVTITVSGMAAIFSTLRLFQHVLGHGLVVVFGFPYLDTLKIMQRSEWNPSGCIFLGIGEGSDYEKLEILLEKHNGLNRDESIPKIKALFTEFPTNPLLKCTDLVKVMKLAKKYDFLVSVDDTISSIGNVDLMTGLAQVDVVCSSLTKIFSGAGNVLAGGIIVNPYGRHATALRQVISSGELEICDLSFEDAAVLEFNSRDFLPRTYRCSSSSLELTKRLLNDPRVRTVYYPGVRSNGLPDPIYESLLKPKTTKEGPGFGCLLSILLKDESNTPSFFDNLNISKGPSLGTNFTLSCPYTLLAHYQELSWAAEYGVDKYIIRVSVGLEDIEDIWNRFAYALDMSCGKL